MGNKEMMDRHIRNMRVMAGKPATSGKYDFVISSNDIVKRYYESKKDLMYSLKKEVSRDRFVANSEGLQKTIIQTVSEVLEQEMDEIAEVISQDVIYRVETAFNGGGNANNIKSMKKSYMSRLGAMLGRALAKIPFNIMKELDK